MTLRNVQVMTAMISGLPPRGMWEHVLILPDFSAGPKPGPMRLDTTGYHAVLIHRRRPLQGGILSRSSVRILLRILFRVTKPASNMHL